MRLREGRREGRLRRRAGIAEARAVESGLEGILGRDDALNRRSVQAEDGGLGGRGSRGRLMCHSHHLVVILPTGTTRCGGRPGHHRWAPEEARALQRVDARHGARPQDQRGADARTHRCRGTRERQTSGLALVATTVAVLGATPRLDPG